jgi:zinc transporter ZupT
VFFMLAFGHLLPEALEGFSVIGRSHEAALLCVLAGYFAMFIFDKVLFDPHGSAGDTAAGDKGNKTDAKDARVWDRSSMTLVGAMSIHSAFETVALGLSHDKKSATLMFASIAVHQPAESVALLVALLKSGMTKGQIAHLLLAYSGVGIIATLASTFLARFATPTVDAYVMALTAGTFLYVSATEVS